MSDTTTLIQRLAALPAANVGDAMERLGVVDQGVQSIWRGARVVGPAVTVEVAAGDNLGIHAALDVLVPGDVLVVNGHGGDRALIGELIAERLRKKGCVGIVVDGVVRDVDDIAELEFPAFARGASPAGPYKHGPYRIGRPVAIGGVVVEPGDVVVGDGDGVVVVPQAELESIVERAEAKHADELAIRRSITEG